MDNTFIGAIEVVKNRVKEKEEELNRLKKAVNDMAKDAGLPPVYASVASENAGSIASLRSDQFYGQGLSTAIRMYLEMRKASGLSSAGVNEIYDAIKNGGFKFDTQNDLNAKTGVRNTLRKNTAQFHRLPNGEYGLLAWYPNAKQGKNGDDDEPEADKKPKDKKAAVEATAENSSVTENFFTNGDIREAIAGVTGNFGVSDIEKKLKTNFPSKTIRTGSVPTVIFTMKKKGLLKLIAERQGKRGATYCKA
jgi:hypothetical protein